MGNRRPSPSGKSTRDRVFKIERRVLEKIDDYHRYSFSEDQDCALKTFFDLSQEFQSQADFYRVCVMVPKLFYGLKSALYLLDDNESLRIVCHSEDLYSDSPSKSHRSPPLCERPIVSHDSFLAPVKGNRNLPSVLPGRADDGLLGMFETYPASSLSDHMRLFLEKYVNRIGFQLHSRLLAERNKEHLRFINSLVDDIGHNVIVPNMYYRLFFKRLKGKIDRAQVLGRELRDTLERAREKCQEDVLSGLSSLHEELLYLGESMQEQFDQIMAHYEQTSLFLETLLRRSHFEQGRYVLEPTRTNFKEKIIRPQLDRYLPRLAARNIAVDDQLSGIPDEEITVVADVGLLAQVYANLFTNAVKYTREVRDSHGRPQKRISLGMKILKNYFDGTKDGIKFNVFTTGPAIPAADIQKLFEEGYRGQNAEEEYGTGHGLYFIREVVQLHGGVVGVETTPLGNNFYFVLPK